MWEIMIYAVAFFLITLLIQYLFYKARRNRGKNNTFWTGRHTAIIMCTIGIWQEDVNVLGAVLGFLIADEIGKKLGWW